MRKTLGNLEIPNIFLILLLLGLASITFRIFSPYLNIIIISLVIVQSFHPLYKFIFNRTKSSALSTFVSILVALIVVIVPLVIILLLTINEVKNLSDGNNILDFIGNLQFTINNTINNLNNGMLKSLGFELSQIDLRTLAVIGANSLKDQLLPIATQILSLSGEILFNLFIFILCLIYLFPMYDRLPQIFSSISPLEADVDKLFFEKLRETTKGVIKGSLVVAILQATAVLVPLLLLQIGAPVLLWLIMVILSIVPVGSGVIWAPIGFGIIFEGISSGNSTQIILGILLLVYSGIIINVIDTTIRPRLMKGAVNIHPLATIFSVLGGIAAFGVLGIIYGPIILVLFLTVTDIYNKKFLKEIPNHETA